MVNFNELEHTTFDEILDKFLMQNAFHKQYKQNSSLQNVKLDAVSMWYAVNNIYHINDTQILLFFLKHVSCYAVKLLDEKKISNHI